MCSRTWCTLVVGVEQDRHLAVALDAGHRLDDDPLEVLGMGGGFERKGHDQS
jgi:hypothetical protein